MLKKELAVAVVVLFLGVSVIPSVVSDNPSFVFLSISSNKTTRICDNLETNNVLKSVNNNPKPSIEWNKTFGREDTVDVGFSVQQTLDGGYIILANSAATCGSQVWLIKTDIDGNMIWDKTFGGMGYDQGWSIKQTSDNGYIVAGTTYYPFPSPQRDDVWLLKTDSNGNEIWNKTFKGNLSEWNFFSVDQTVDGGYVLIGNLEKNSIIKTDEIGNVEWNKSFKSKFKIFSGQQTNDGGYILSGTNDIFEFGDAWLVKLDSCGNTVWNRTFVLDDYDYSYSYGFDVVQTVDNGYVMLVEKTYGFTTEMAAIVKTDSQGNMMWNRAFQEFDYHGYSIQQTYDRGFVITGWKDRYGDDGFDSCNGF